MDSKLEQTVNSGAVRFIKSASYFDALNYLRHFAIGMQRYLVSKGIFTNDEMQHNGLTSSLGIPEGLAFYVDGVSEADARKEGHRVIKLALKDFELSQSLDSKKEIELIYQNIFLKLYLKLKEKGKNIFVGMPKDSSQIKLDDVLMPAYTPYNLRHSFN